MHTHKKLLYELGEEFLYEKGSLWLKVISPSMEPLIRTGDSILVGSAADEQISIGDVIVFKRREGIFVTHRVIGRRRIKGELCFLEKGDRIDIATWIPRDSIIGKVKAIKRETNIIFWFNNSRWSLLISKLFALYQLICYGIGRIFNLAKNWAKEYRAISFLKRPCRYCYHCMKKTRELVKKLANPLFVKVMKLSG